MLLSQHVFDTLLLLPSSQDLEFVKSFLLIYQSFTTPDELLNKLEERYHVVRPEGMSLKEFVVMRQTIQLRVINALKLWVELSVDFIGMLCFWINVPLDMLGYLWIPLQTIRTFKQGF